METNSAIPPVAATPITFDDAISLADACKLLPCRSGKPPHIDTVRRWTVSGSLGRAGNRVKLRAFRMGNHWYTRVSWVRSFVSACTDNLELSVAPLSPANPSRLSGGMSEARKQLIARGMYGPEARDALLGTKKPTKRK